MFGSTRLLEVILPYLCEGVLEVVAVAPMMVNHDDLARQRQEADHQVSGAEMDHTSVLALVWVVAFPQP